MVLSEGTQSRKEVTVAKGALAYVVGAGFINKNVEFTFLPDLVRTKPLY